ncbi:MAG: phospholipase [Deltaproteobacteria bacterium]|nr:phospholipase [Deltaproteobacteria bacterium]
MRTVTTELAGLTCRFASAENAKPELLVVLCHGYGAPGHDLVPVAAEVLRARPALAERVMFCFPAAPLSLGGVPPFESRAWWPIDVGRFERALTTGSIAALREDVPEGLASARRLLLGLLDALQRQTGLPMGRIVLGGFSQGAMLATDLTLRLDEAPAALAIFSGTMLAESEWRRLAPRRRGLRVLQTHGRQDPLLPFVSASWVRELLAEAGLEVRYLPFDGPHTIGAEGVHGLADLLGDLLAVAGSGDSQ